MEIAQLDTTDPISPDIPIYGIFTDTMQGFCIVDKFTDGRPDSIRCLYAKSHYASMLYDYVESKIITPKITVTIKPMPSSLPTLNFWFSVGFIADSIADDGTLSLVKFK